MGLAPHLTLLNLGRAQWIMAEPADMLDQWAEVETEAQATYNETFGDHAPRWGGSGRSVRQAVVGWSALREKLIARDLELDDVTLELMKIAIMRTVGLCMGHDRNGSCAEPTAVLLGVYDDVALDTEAWAPLWAQFDGKPLVDLRRMISGQG